MATLGKNNAGHASPRRVDFGDLDERSGPADRIGLIGGIVVMILGAVLMAMWADSRSNFEKCATLTDVSARLVCYEQIRQQEMRPPAKGANAPAFQSGN